MHKLIMYIAFVLSLFLLPVASVGALGGVVISRVQPGPDDHKTSEFIEIYNNSDTDIEITNWCLNYASSNYLDSTTMTLSWSKKACYLVENDSLHLFLPKRSSSLMTSKDFVSANPSVSYDLSYAATLSLVGGHVRIVDGDNVEADRLGWGTAVAAEGFNPIASPANGNVLSRIAVSPGVLKDTDINNLDFEQVSANFSYGSKTIYEVQDMCRNIQGIQSTLPEGYVSETTGDCVLAPPTDLCPNLDGLQTQAPLGYEMNSNKECVAKVLPIQITEMLPDAIGADDNNEFIELYNPNAVEINLEQYKLDVGLNYERTYNFPLGATIKPNSYAVFFNSALKFTLVNTSSKARIKSIDGSVIDSTPEYVNPSAGESWAKLDDRWIYTNRPTPGGENLGAILSSAVIATTAKSDSSTLTPCKVGYERNPTTNRCRKITVAVSYLTPCKAGYERNPVTNRCRKATGAVLGSNTLTPCKVGYERNPTTNRCRKITASTIPAASYKPKQLSANTANHTLLWSIGAVCTIALGYGVWEWRVEINRTWRKVFSFVRARK